MKCSRRCEINYTKVCMAIYQTLPLVPKSSFFSLDDKKEELRGSNFI